MNRLLETARTRLRRLADDDQGTSLLELIVGMAIMTIFMAIFLTAILVMTQTANKVQATSVTTSQTTQAFQRLDKIVRYASAVSTPGVSATSGDWYLELDSPATTVGGADTCTQLRIDSNMLQLRTWTLANGAAGTASAWVPIASFITNGTAAAGSANVPFTAPAASASASTTFQRLQVVLVSTSGNGTTATNRAQMTFTALNSDASVPSNATTCQQWGRP